MCVRCEIDNSVLYLLSIDPAVCHKSLIRQFSLSMPFHDNININVDHNVPSVKCLASISISKSVCVAVYQYGNGVFTSKRNSCYLTPVLWATCFQRKGRPGHGRPFSIELQPNFLLFI
ncbi:putative transaldolase [Frankliniella fusca]|uniref:Transaldolase n=1 Tax=Frankliniella fusca TaxID=407009 RepID=A0AAE1HLC8_9NEOP|nr:putative transaldolase [Frankliniella fusca]KAK3923477.1 putative transaldolase [Frankliniella fusca]